MTDNVVPLNPKPIEKLACKEITRDPENPNRLIVNFNQPPSETQMRLFKDCMSRWTAIA
jgi:hypothetical protein